MAYRIPKSEFEPHPEGRHTGTISKHEDLGMQDTPWGPKPKVAIWIESETARQEDGSAFDLLSWFTLAGGPRANLRKFREAVLDRPLTVEEDVDFDPDKELIGKRITYRVDHVTGDDGRIRARLREGSVEPASPIGRPVPSASKSAPKTRSKQPPPPGDDDSPPF